MAKSTTVIRKMPVDPDEKRKQDLLEIEDALVENKDAILDTLSLLQQVQKTEAFHIAGAVLGQSDHLMTRLVVALDDPNITQALKNLLLLVGALGTVKMADLEPMLFKLNSALHKVAEYEHNEKAGGGYSSLLKSLKDPEMVEGLNTMLAFVQGMGVDQSANEENQSQFERSTLAGHAYNKTSFPDKEKKEEQVPKKWYVIAAGALAFALPLLLNRK